MEAIRAVTVASESQIYDPDGDVSLILMKEPHDILNEAEEDTEVRINGISKRRHKFFLSAHYQSTFGIESFVYRFY
jgi:hypothetical protein